MKKGFRLVLIASTIGISACGGGDQGEGPGADTVAESSPQPGSGEAGMTATTELRNREGEPIGGATLTQEGDEVVISFDVRDLPPGERGFHFHEVGDCTPPDHQSAGSHFNPSGVEHGREGPSGGHAGDMQNVTAASDGTVRETVRTNRVTLRPNQPHSLLDANGSTLILHENRDDHTPDAVTGARIACGVIASA